MKRHMEIFVLDVLILKLVNGMLMEEYNINLIDSNYTNASDLFASNINHEKTIDALFHQFVLGNHLINYCIRPSSCADLFYSGTKTSGIYKIYPKPWMRKNEIEVYCDMETDGGGWTVIQRRGEFGTPHINFTRSWTEYANGFGNLLEEFWLGNDNIYVLSSQEQTSLRFDLADFEGNKRYAVYGLFVTANETDRYRLHVEDYGGNAGEALFEYHEGRTFVAWDAFDINECSRRFRGGWWYGHCHLANPNGEYLPGKTSIYAQGINWKPWLGHYYSMKKFDMKLRPKHFTS